MKCIFSLPDLESLYLLPLLFFFFFWPLGVLLPAVKYNLHVVLCRLDTVNFWPCFSIDLDCHMGILFSWSLFPESEILFYPSLGLSAATLSGPSGITHEREASKAEIQDSGLKCLHCILKNFFYKHFLSWWISMKAEQIWDILCAKV